MQRPMSSDSRNTIQMLNESTGWEISGDEKPYADFDSSQYMPEQNPKKLRDFYKEFCEVIRHCQQKRENGNDEINLLEVMMGLHLLCTSECKHGGHG